MDTLKFGATDALLKYCPCYVSFGWKSHQSRAFIDADREIPALPCKIFGLPYGDMKITHV